MLTKDISYINNKQNALTYHVLNTEVHFVGYFYIMGLKNARRMKHIKITKDTSYKISPLYNFRKNKK